MVEPSPQRLMSPIQFFESTSQTDEYQLTPVSEPEVSMSPSPTPQTGVLLRPNGASTETSLSVSKSATSLKPQKQVLAKSAMSSQKLPKLPRDASPQSSPARRQGRPEQRWNLSGEQRLEEEKRFQIRNTDTGECVDVRDENKSNFAANLAKVLKADPAALLGYW